MNMTVAASAGTVILNTDLISWICLPGAFRPFYWGKIAPKFKRVFGSVGLVTRDLPGRSARDDTLLP
jgi:hypothetical protein